VALLKLDFKPGVNKEDTPYTAEGGWVESDKIRFRSGRPEKMEGWEKYQNTTVEGVTRRLHPFRDLAGTNYVAIGTTEKVYVETGGTFIDITPIRDTLTTTATDNCVITTNTSTTVRINVTSHGCDDGAWVTISGVTGTVGGVPDAEINAEHKITYVDVDNFDITVTTAATSSVAGGGGTAIDIECQINPGPVNGLFQYGFGSGTWAAGTWGTPRSSSIPLDPRIWNFANWGEDLILNYQGGAVYIWDASTATDRAVQITEAPYKVDNILVTRDRHLVCFGCNPPGTANEFQPKEDLLIRWCSQEDYTAWTVTSTNTAGDQLLTNGTRIVGAADVESQVIVWTDSDVQSMQFLGPPYTFGFNQIGTNAGMISSRAWAAYSNIVYWMGDSAFYVFQGGTNVLPCTMQKYVFDNLDLTQRRKIFCAINRRNHEVTWYYPAVSQKPRYLNGATGAANTTIQLETTAGLPVSGDVQIDAEVISFTSKNDTQLLGCTRGTSGTTAAAHADGASVTSTTWTLEPYHYVTYSVVDKIWWEGKLERTAMIDSGNLSNPIGVDYNGQLYYHEKGYDADGAPLVAYIQSGDFDIAEGDSLMHIHRVIPDFSVDGSVDLTMQTKYYPLDSETREVIGTVTPTTQKINTRIRARNMALRIESKDAGDWWKYGSTKIDQRTDGRR
jgi:hypothetical protein